MSSRSKEKVTAVIRKLFKSSDKLESGGASSNNNNNNNSNNNNNINNGSNGNNGNSNNNNNNNNGACGGGGPSSTGSPNRRLRRGISPAPNIPNIPFMPKDTTIKTRRLMKEYKELQKVQSTESNPIFTVELVNDNLCEWYARLHVVDPDSPLAEDMTELNIPYILLHLVFPDNFPFAPPFMRVVEPRIEKGFVMEGGAICMELLTPRGWASAYTVEAVIMQFAASLVKGQGRIARKPKSSKEFSRRSAEEAFRSLVKTHEKYGWVTPALSDG